MRDIITYGLYTFKPLFEVHLCTMTFDLMYGQYSRAGYSDACTVYQKRNPHALRKGSRISKGIFIFVLKWVVLKSAFYLGLYSKFPKKSLLCCKLLSSTFTTITAEALKSREARPTLVGHWDQKNQEIAHQLQYARHHKLLLIISHS